MIFRLPHLHWRRIEEGGGGGGGGRVKGISIGEELFE